MKNFSRYRNCLRLVVVLLCVGLLATAAWAQSTTQGAIGGTVADPQNLVVPNAVVTVTNTGTNQAQSATTNETGYFRVVQLQPGTYTVTVKAQGFAPYKAENVIVSVGSLTPVNPHLTIGATEHVEVSGEAPVINVTSAEIAPTLNEKAIQNLPINGGRWSSFAMLTPGVVSDSSGFGLVSVRGMSPLLNNVTIDGADNNQAFFSEERGRTRAGYSTPKVAIQEFQVNTSNYSSEYGRSAGGVINSVTKSGNNQLHGEAYFYDRDNSWGSMNAYTTLTKALYANGTDNAPTGSVTSPYKPVDVRKMGGFGVGGAIIKDKLFWYLAVDRYHRNFPGTAVPSNAGLFFQMPDAALPTGTTCGTVTSGTADNNVCQLASLLANKSNSSTNMRTVTTAQYSDAYTKYVDGLFGNPTTDQLGLLSVTGRVPRTGDQDIILPKLDWVVNEKNHLSLTVNRMRWWSPAGIQTQATNPYGNTSFGNDYVSDTWGVAKLNTQLSSIMTNELRFQYGRDFEWETNQTPSAYDGQTFLTPASGYTNPLGVPPNIYVSSSFQWGSTLYGNRVAYPSEYKTQLADSVSMMHGNHSLKFGVDWVKNDDTIKNLYQQYAEFSYSGLPQYFADLYNPYTNYNFYSNFYQAFQGNSITNPVQSYRIATNDFAFFFQDDWKIARRLTLNFGARFETELMPQAFDSLVNTISMGSQSVTLGKTPNSPANIGPRIGFAWDIFGDSKTVLRGGYGIYFGRITNAALFSGMTTTGKATTDGQSAYNIYGGAATACTPVFPQILTAAPNCSASASLAYFDPNFKAPQIHEIDLSLQREIGWNTTLSVSYMGSFGRHLQSFTDANWAAPGTQYCATAAGKQVTGATISDGVCSSGTLVTPPTTLSYTLSNTLNGSEIKGMPLPTSFQITAPYYTSRLTTQYGSVTDVFSGINSSYNAMVLQLEKRFSDHVQFGANYTWSHTLDGGVNGTTTFTGGNNSIDPLNPSYGVYGNSSYNVPNRFTLNAVLEAPWKHSGWLQYLADGWQAAPVFQAQNGLGNSVTAYYPSSGIIVYDGMRQFTSPTGGLLGAGGSSQIVGSTRNGFKQPSTYVTDLRFSKTFPIRERFKAEFSVDGFNIFNHQNVTGVGTTTAYQINNPSAPAAGTPTGTPTYPTLGPNNTASAIANGASLFNVPSSANSNFVYSTRQIQLGLRLTF
jgi:Carboxypeptidase regulatory-like domain